MSERDFRLVKNGKTQVWSIRQDGDTITTNHGLLNGRLQTYSDRPGEKGLAHSKAYMSPEENATFCMDREIRKKMETGYREWKDGAFIGEAREESIDFSKSLPKHFCSYKPKSDISLESLKKLEDKGNLLFTRKVNGFCHVAAHHTDGWKIYSRRMDDLSQHFPLHIERLNILENFKVGTILVGEMVCWDEKEKDDFKKVSRFCRSLPVEARQLIVDGEVPEPTFIVFDCLFFNGEDLKDKNYHQRQSIWREGLLLLNKIIRPIGLVHTTAGTWQMIVKSEGWEGLVAVDVKTTPGEKFYSFTGKAERPNCSFKLKPVWTEDVIVYAGSTGQGKRLNGVGAVHTAQINPNTGKYFSCGKVGSGFCDEDLEEIEKQMLALNIPILKKDKEADDINLEDCPKLVVEVEYRDRQPGTNKFQHGVFIRMRADKGPEECIQAKFADEVD